RAHGSRPLRLRPDSTPVGQGSHARRGAATGLARPAASAPAAAYRASPFPSVLIIPRSTSAFLAGALSASVTPVGIGPTSGGIDGSPGQVLSAGTRAAAALVYRARRLAGPATAAAAPGHSPASRPRRSCPALPGRAHSPGSLGGAAHRHPR